MEAYFSIHCSCIPISYTSVALTAEQEADLMANLYYVNLHSLRLLSEIRGQLVKELQPTNTGGYTGGLLRKHLYFEPSPI
jgi:hypothetical protein